MPLIGHVIPWNPRAICNYTSFLLFVKPPQQLFYLVILSLVDPVQNQIIPWDSRIFPPSSARTLCHPFHFISATAAFTAAARNPLSSVASAKPSLRANSRYTASYAVS
jgi:hypothetical protein